MGPAAGRSARERLTMRIMSLALYPVENGKFRCRQSARVRTVSDWPIAGYTNSALVGQLDARPFAGTRREARGPGSRPCVPEGPLVGSCFGDGCRQRSRYPVVSRSGGGFAAKVYRLPGAAGGCSQ